MSDAGKLCRVYGGSALAYKSGGSALIYKSAAAEEYGDIIVVVTAEVSQVGPIQGCGNVHEVRVSCAGSTGIGAVSATFPPASTTISVTTESVGCAYPQNNPSMTFSVVVVQNGSSSVFSVPKIVENVAEGNFTIVLRVVDSVLTEVE